MIFTIQCESKQFLAIRTSFLLVNVVRSPEIVLEY